MKKNAFTLIEILAVFTIIAILMVFGFMQLSSINNEVNAKNEVVATANIIRVMEDYLLTKEVKLTNQVPLYFSVNALINQGLLSEDVNQTLDSKLNQSDGATYFVKVVKENQQINYSVLTEEGLKNDIGNLVGEASFVSKSGTFSNNVEVNYNLEKTVYFTFKYSSNIYDVVIKSIKYTLKHRTEGTTTGPIIVKDIKKDAATGYYYFTLKNKVEPGVYDLKMTLETELNPAAAEINATYTSIDPNTGTIITDTTVSKIGWGNVADPNVILTASGYNSATNVKADAITYSYKKYSNTAKTNLVEDKATTNLTLDANKVGTITLNSEGVYDITFQSFLKSKAGSTVTYEVKIDKTAPALTSLTISDSSGSGSYNNIWKKINLRINFNGTDSGPSGLARFERTITSGTGAGSTATYTATDRYTADWSDDRNSTIAFKAIDNAGNSSISSSVIMKIDKTAPSCTSSGGSTSWTTGPVTLTGTCSDGGSGCQGNVTKTYSAPIDSTTESPGYVYDNAGNSKYCPANQTVRITTPPDTTPPSCTSSGGSASWTTGNRTLTGTCSDSGSGCTGNASTTYSTNTNTTTASPGYVYDNAGNSTYCPANQTVRIDKTAPSCTSSGGSTSWTTSPVTLTGTCSDALSGCQGNITKTYSSPIDSTTESPGYVYDYAGNSTYCPANQTVRISAPDTTPPTCISSGGSATWTNGNVTLTGTCSDGGSGCTGNVSKTYSTNTNTTTASPGTVYDKAGNSTACPANQTVKIDKTSPTLTTLTVSNTSGSGSYSNIWKNIDLRINFAGSDTGGSGVAGFYRIITAGDDTGVETNYAATTTYTNNWTAERNSTVAFRVSDNAGNVSSFSNVVVKIDKTDPTVLFQRCDVTGTASGVDRGINITITDAISTKTHVYYGYNYTNGFPWAARFFANSSSSTRSGGVQYTPSSGSYLDAEDTSFKYIRLYFGGSSNSDQYKAGVVVEDAAGNKIGTGSSPISSIWYTYDVAAGRNCWFPEP